MRYKLPHGFTLIEVALVLVILGLLIGGILRGQELINSARARNIIDQKSSIQTAIVAFSNRYKSTPGDLTAAQSAFIGGNILASTAGAGNGIITLNAGATNESVLVFQNLSATGFLACTACMTVTGNGAGNSSNSPTNPYGSFLQFGTVPASADGVSWLDRQAVLPAARNVLTTGAQIPDQILLEIDIKSDDGAPHTGLFRQSTTGGAGTTHTCAPPLAPPNAANSAWANTGGANCAGAWLF